MAVDYLVMTGYLLGLVGAGWWGKKRAASKSEFLVAGRRLGPLMYTGTMAAIVLGGASTVGGVGLGYSYGISGAAMVFAIGLGLLALSIFFSARIARLRVYTVAEMLSLRYGDAASVISGVVMWMYTLMLVVTSTIAYASVFDVLFDVPRWAAIVIGGTIVVGYSVLGGMWSITLTDMVQFVVKSVGVLLLLLPIAVVKAGGFAAMGDQLPHGYLSPTSIGGQTIFTYVLIYTFGMLIGQDIWQRVFTARSEKVAVWGGTAAGAFCLVYALAGAFIGMATKVLHPRLASADQAFAAIVKHTLPPGIKGLVLAAALSAMMSTASGALIASATVANNDIWARLRRLGRHKAEAAADPEESDEVASNRLAIAILGVTSMAIACALGDVMAALTAAYDLLVGGLLIPILGGLVWRRGNLQGALTSMVVGGTTVITFMVTDGLLANEPIYYGLLASLVAYVTVSLVTKPTEEAVVEGWRRRVAGESAGTSAAPATTTV
ncbi:sodium:solute symporter [Streptomyces sp. NBC_01795]|uniref:sodium:solute symporter n=1 Tax=unclassified Streptomyces TaxID=2593676 RepID=UPI002DDA5465|nr:MULTISPECIES: sodium:solute symporter [unclassified Streptomyces]WSA97498.1 sodium:solute symporter [Streptomyces sp. NBC_01795]WSB81926.1 sodium:solute symporter [Streptomyces sp. NBC_01775]WSS17316.1 sodium:solute symporter [Streptomyces sp. NBC_01186]